MAGLNLTFMGDDTWTGLFPNSFRKSFAYPSFDVWDIHTVDDGVTAHLSEEMAAGDWQVLIAHCLGVDHIGHRFGPEHPQMKSKLRQMDSLIENVVGNMDSETLLLVIGDHGMTQTGDHGGDSSDEINSALFAYSRNGQISSTKRVDQAPTDSLMNQVDLVPTLALLMGVPIPFSNLGAVNLDLIAPEKDPGITEKHFELIKLTRLGDALNLNVGQIWRYLSSYEGSSFPIAEFQELESLFQEIDQIYQRLNSRCSENMDYCTEEVLLEEMIRKSQSFLSKSKEMCRSIWAQFDLLSIAVGLAIFAVALMVNWMSISDVIDLNSIQLMACCSLTAFILQV